MAAGLFRTHFSRIDLVAAECVLVGTHDGGVSVA